MTASRYLFVASEPSTRLYKLLNFTIRKGTYKKRYGEVEEPKPVEKIETGILELNETEKKIVQTLEDLKQEKRKIFSLVALNMKKKNERRKQKQKLKNQ
ncbi:hypothetical protein HDV06_000946 [Boothiomyces sp. JEL0866]|nr:hypothetical protein HDV06_000946 [Boothiomyces sp. JEL0866]